MFHFTSPRHSNSTVFHCTQVRFVGGLRTDESGACDTRVLRDGLRPEVFENNRVEASLEFDIGDARS